jgi:hypothetical protein
MRSAYTIMMFLFTILLLVEVYQFGQGSSFSNPGLGSAVAIKGNLTYAGGNVGSSGTIGSVGGICPNQQKAAGPVALPPSVCSVVSTIAGDPLTVAIIIGGAFTALGLLAGTLGVGILASKVALVGMSLGFVAGINAGIANNFVGIPVEVWIIVNGILGLFMVILIMDALSGGVAAPG